MTPIANRSLPRLAAATMQRGAKGCVWQRRGSVQRWQKHQRGAGFQA